MNYYSKHLCFKLMPQDRKVLLAVVSVSFTAVSAMGCLSLSLSFFFPLYVFSTADFREFIHNTALLRCIKHVNGGSKCYCYIGKKFCCEY